jgi:hypothetical protein
MKICGMEVGSSSVISYKVAQIAIFELPMNALDGIADILRDAYSASGTGDYRFEDVLRTSESTGIKVMPSNFVHPFEPVWP